MQHINGFPGVCYARDKMCRSNYVSMLTLNHADTEVKSVP